MSKIREFLAHPVIQMALAIGASIIILSWFSKRVLPEPLGTLPQAIPPFIGALWEYILHKYKDRELGKVKYGVAAVLLATVAVIGLHWQQA